jgi:hypothetical protein
MTAKRSAVLLVIVGLCAFVLVRWLLPIVGVGNPDIAGILYSADRLNEGLLPYRDTVDIKAPGSFFIVAAVFRFVARDLHVLRIVFAAWLLMGAPAIAIAARTLYGADADRDRPRMLDPAAASVALYLVTAGAFDMNYTSWMMPAYAWAFAMLVLGLRRDRVYLHVLAGVLAAFAYLLKTQAVVIVAFFVLIWIGSRRKGDGGARVSVFAYWAIGALLGALPLALFYASKGALSDLIHGIFPVEASLAYTARRGVIGHDFKLIWLVPFQQIQRFPLHVALSAAAVIGVIRRKAEGLANLPLAPQLVFYGASLAGCGLGGMRFYLHYLLQCLPAVALLGAHPAALDWLLASRLTAKRSWVFIVSRAHAALAMLLALFVVGRIPFGLGSAVENRGSDTAILAGQFVHEHTTRSDRLLVWGWGGWGAYYFADRRSPSRVFKVMGQITDFNDNSAFSRETPMHFRDGPLAERFLDEMRADPPAYIIRAVPFFPGSSDDPLEEFTALREMIARDYVVAATFGGLRVYQRIAR